MSKSMFAGMSSAQIEAEIKRREEEYKTKRDEWKKNLRAQQQKEKRAAQKQLDEELKALGVEYKEILQTWNLLDFSLICY